MEKQPMLIYHKKGCPNKCPYKCKFMKSLHITKQFEEKMDPTYWDMRDVGQDEQLSCLIYVIPLEYISFDYDNFDHDTYIE